MPEVRCSSVDVFAAADGVPEEIPASGALLRRRCVGDARGIAEAVKVSLDELRPWRSWATDEAADPDSQRRRLEAAVGLWEQGSDYSYVVVGDDEPVLGVISLMARVGPRALEIGYWLRSDWTGRGIATSCVAALTEAGLDAPGVDLIEIHCDEANVRSAAIPRRLGYRLDRVEDEEITAPGEIGRNMIWTFPPDEKTTPEPLMMNRSYIWSGPPNRTGLPRAHNPRTDEGRRSGTRLGRGRWARPGPILTERTHGSRFSLRQPPERLLTMICRNIALRAAALMVAPRCTATVRAVLLP